MNKPNNNIEEIVSDFGLGAYNFNPFTLGIPATKSFK